MTRDETIALFVKCEEKRAEVRAAALKKGKSKRQAAGIAHIAARSVWNSWANEKLLEREKLINECKWRAGERYPGSGDNKETRFWMAGAMADFSQVRFELLPATIP